MNIRRMTAGAVVASMVAIAPSHAELLAYEGFDYATQGSPGKPTKQGDTNGAGEMPKAINQLDGGTGWAKDGQWSLTEGSADGSINVAKQFEVLPEGMAAEGGTLQLYRVTAERELAEAMKVDKPLFITFLHLDNGAYTTPRGLELRNGDKAMLGLIAKSKADGGNWTVQAGEEGKDLNGINYTDLESLWVLKLEPAGDKTKVSIARMQVEQADLSQEPAYAASIEVPTVEFDRVAFLQPQKASHMGDSAAWFDELRIATTYAAAVGKGE